MTEALVKSGLDMARLQSDLDAHDVEVTALLKRNLEQADSIGLQGTPVFLIGPAKWRRRWTMTGSRMSSRKSAPRRSPPGDMNGAPSAGSVRAQRAIG